MVIRLPPRGAGRGLLLTVLVPAAPEFLAGERDTIGLDLLATPWLPSTDLIGPNSLGPLVLIALYALMAGLRRSRVVLVAGPVVLLAAAVESEAFPFSRFRRFPDADDYLGYYLLLAGAGVAAMELARVGTARSLGIAQTLFFAATGLLTLEIVWRVQDLVFGPFAARFSGWVVLWTAVIGMPLFAIAGWRMAQPYRRLKRAREGRCPGCGYDLRASPDRCPECGHVMMNQPRPVRAKESAAA